MPEGWPGDPAGIKVLAEQADLSQAGRLSQGEWWANVMVALDLLVRGSPAYRMEALAPVSHGGLVVLTAQATVELQLLGGSPLIGNAGDDHDRIYLAASKASKQQLRAALDATLNQLTDRHWEMPPTEDEDE
jgi:hypothetical protein